MVSPRDMVSVAGVNRSPLIEITFSSMASVEVAGEHDIFVRTTSARMRNNAREFALRLVFMTV
jgi:hypothetical protein